MRKNKFTTKGICMALTLTLSSPKLNKQSLQNETTDLCLQLGRKGMTAELATQSGADDDKAIDLPVWAQITVAAIPSVALLINVLTARVQRTKSLTIKLDGNTGQPIEISATNLDEEKLNELFAKYVKTDA